MTQHSRAEIDRLAEALWAPFRPEVSSGVPVFFCFSADMLAETLDVAGVDCPDPAAYVSECARSLLVIDWHSVYVLPATFDPSAKGLTPVVILICQQVLAVEAMFRDPRGFSENAYFPRLRAMISPTLAGISSNPYEFDQFEKIWRTFAQEIRSTRGSREESITFRFGIDQGVNKARAFPFSQALLSQQDLTAILSRLRAERIGTLTPERLWAEVRRHRDQIGRRGQRLLNVSALRHRILEQIRSFARVASKPNLAESVGAKTASHTWKLRAYKESVDWMTEEIRLFLYDELRAVRNYERSDVDDEVMRALAKNNVISMPETELGDCWETQAGEVWLNPGDSMVVVGTSVGVSEAVGNIAAVGGSAPPFVRGETAGAVGTDVIAVEIEWPNSNSCSLIWGRGQAMLEFTQLRQRPYAWIGGIRIGRGFDKYLWSELPTAVRFGDDELPLQAVVKIDERFIGYTEFRKSVKDLVEDAAFTFTFSGDRKARLAVGVCRVAVRDVIGFPLSEGGKIAPTAERVEAGEACIVGFHAIGLRTVTTMDVATWARLLRDLRAASGTVLADRFVLSLKEQVSSAPIPRESKAAIGWLLDRPEVRVSAEFLAELRLPMD